MPSDSHELGRLSPKNQSAKHFDLELAIMDAKLKKTLKPSRSSCATCSKGDTTATANGSRAISSSGWPRSACIATEHPCPSMSSGIWTTEDRQARKVVDAYLKLREEAGVERSDAVAEFIRETAYTWANRLMALRCMEARELIDTVILQQEAYGGRSLEHHRLAQRHRSCAQGEDDGLFAVLDKVFREQTGAAADAVRSAGPGIASGRRAAAIKDCFGLLSLTADVLRKYRIRIKEDETANADAEPPIPFIAPDALGWTYQYWNTEEKDRVFETGSHGQGSQDRRRRHRARHAALHRGLHGQVPGAELTRCDLDGNASRVEALPSAGSTTYATPTAPTVKRKPVRGNHVPRPCLRKRTLPAGSV